MIPKLSVIMTVLNGDSYLISTLDSLQQQTFSDYELIVNDNGSTDRTLDILHEYASQDSRIRILYPTKANNSFTEGIGRSFNAANAPLIAVNDADDISLKDRFTKQVEFLNKSQDYVAIASWYDQIDGMGKIFNTNKLPLRVCKEYLIGNPIAHSSLMYRKSSAIKVGGYQKCFTYASDYSLQVGLLAEGGHIGVLPEALVQIRVHDRQTSSKQIQRSQYYKEPIEILSKSALLANIPISYRFYGMFSRQKIALHYGSALWQEKQYLTCFISTIYWLLHSFTSLFFIRKI